MDCAEPVSIKTFLRHVDLSPLLDEGDTARAYIADARRSDPNTGAFRSWWGARRCWFLHTAGFEFIFVED